MKLANNYSEAKNIIANVNSRTNIFEKVVFKGTKLLTEDFNPTIHFSILSHLAYFTPISRTLS